MPRAYTLTDWSIHGPRVLELKQAGKSFKAIEEIIGVKQEAIRAWFNKQPKPATPEEAAPMNIQFDPLPTDPVTVLEGQLSIDDADTPPPDPVSTIVDIVPVNGEISESLSPNEVQSLEHYEQIIAQGLQTFVEVGHALLVIRDQRLYRHTYQTFEDYLGQRWDLSRPRAYQLISAAQVIDTVSTIVDIVPINESQARPLTSLPPAQQVEVWREVVETAPAGKVTAKHVKETVKRAKRQATGQNGITPKPKDPEPRRSARHEVQEGLVWGLREVKDEDAWELLVWLWTELNKRAPQYESLRGMLERVQRRFPEELRPQLSTE